MNSEFGLSDTGLAATDGPTLKLAVWALAAMHNRLVPAIVASRPCIDFMIDFPPGWKRIEPAPAAAGSRGAQASVAANAIGWLSVWCRSNTSTSLLPWRSQGAGQ